MPVVEGYAHVAKDPGYCGGAARVVGTGIRVISIWQMYQDGKSARQISEEYEGLLPAAVFSALAYAADHRAELEAYKKEEAASTAALLKDYVPLHVMKAARKAADERADVLS